MYFIIFILCNLFMQLEHFALLTALHLFDSYVYFLDYNSSAPSCPWISKFGSFECGFFR